jgi:flagellar hook protein FlgE
MDSVFATARSGFQKAESRLNMAAVDVANAPTEPADLAQASVELIQAETQYKFSAELVKVSSEMMDTLLSLQER